MGGLTVLRHFEINCGPLTVRLNRGLMVQLWEFINPNGESGSGGDQQHQAAVRATFLGSPTTNFLGTKAKFTQKLRPMAQALQPSSQTQQQTSSLHPGTPPHMLEIPRHDSGGNSPTLRGGSTGLNTPFRRASQELFLSDDGKVLDNAAYQDVAELKKRAQRNIVFKHFRLGEINIFFSYSGRGVVSRGSGRPGCVWYHVSSLGAAFL